MDIFLDILLKPPQPFIGLFLTLKKHASLTAPLRTIWLDEYTDIYIYVTSDDISSLK